MEVSIDDLPIFKTKFVVNYYNLPNSILGQLISRNAYAIEVVDVILIPYNVKESVRSSTITHSPKIYSGNFICGYTVRGGKRSTSNHIQEVDSASNQTAYLSKLVAKQDGPGGRWHKLDQNYLKLPLIIITPDKLEREITEDELNNQSLTQKTNSAD